MQSHLAQLTSLGTEREKRSRVGLELAAPTNEPRHKSIMGDNIHNARRHGNNTETRYDMINPTIR
jgi:hypothetical protein